MFQCPLAPFPLYLGSSLLWMADTAAESSGLATEITFPKWFCFLGFQSRTFLPLIRYLHFSLKKLNSLHTQFFDCREDSKLCPTQGTDPPEPKFPELYLLDLWTISLLGIGLLFSFIRKPENFEIRGRGTSLLLRQRESFVCFTEVFIKTLYKTLQTIGLNNCSGFIRNK